MRRSTPRRARVGGRRPPYPTGIDLSENWDCTARRGLRDRAITRSVLAMPLYFFRIRNGHYSGCADQASEFADRDLAWKEMTSVCADMASGILRKLTENSEWQLELLDESREPVFRIRIVAESLD